MRHSPTVKRKSEHIRICLKEEVQFRKSNGFEAYELEHEAIPEFSLEEIDLATTFLGNRYALPFFIEPLTGGAFESKKINTNLALAAEELGIGMGLGSQRAMVEDPRLTFTYLVREVAPHIILFGNIGAVQLVAYDVSRIRDMIEQVSANGLIIHLNVAQEICQIEGDTDWRDVLAHIRSVCEHSDFPVIVKETGCGISGSVAKRLEEAGVDCLDVAGSGGTSMAKVEYFRGSASAKSFSEWGIPTAESLRQCRESVSIPLIGSGGMRNGVDCAKALAMGAALVGFGLPLLRPALESKEGVLEILRHVEMELRKTMFLVGARDIADLHRARIIKRGVTSSFA